MDILDILRSDKTVSGEIIAKTMGISRAAVHKKIDKLRAAGYGITGTNNSGYILLSCPDVITPEEVKKYLNREGVPAHSVLFFKSTASTQDEAKKAAAGNIDTPILVIAEQQTASYGRLRREWSSPKGGLWFSIVLKPDMAPERIPQLTLAASLAVCRAVEAELGLRPLIKWPNDVVIDGRKFAGILTEMSAEVGRLNWVVVGIGINVNNDIPGDLESRAASLSKINGEKINRPKFLAGLLSEFYGLYGVFERKGFSGFEKEYNQRSYLKGARVKIDTGGGVIEGKAVRVDAEGYLWIRPRGKKPVRIIAGDVLSVRFK